MSAWVDHFGGMLLDASLAAALLSSVVVLGMLACRQPSRRIWLARAAILGTLTVIPLSSFSPLPRVELIRLLNDPSFKLHPLLATPPSPNVTPPPPPRADARRAGRHCHNHPWFLVKAGRRSRVLVSLYLAGMGAGLGWLLFGYWGLGWLTRRSWEPSPATLEVYSSLPWTALRTRPALRVASRVQRPVLLGLFHQTILIPVDLDFPEAKESLRLSLLHELAHADRRDPWFSLASALAQSFWFFLPPMWWIRAQMRLDQEFLADRRAAHGFGPLQVYASSLLDLASPGQETSTPTPTPVSGSGGSGSALFQRVLMLVQCPFPVESQPPGWWRWIFPCLFVFGTVAASTLSLRAPEDGAGLWPSTATAPAPPEKPKTFRMARLTVAPESRGGRGRTALFELPLRLPKQFDLDLEVWGDHTSIARTRVVGQRLSLARPLTNPEIVVEEWHRVHIRRDEQGVSLKVDGQSIRPTGNDSVTVWLSVEPPHDRPAHFQNLVLSW